MQSPAGTPLEHLAGSSTKRLLTDMPPEVFDMILDAVPADSRYETFRSLFHVNREANSRTEVHLLVEVLLREIKQINLGMPLLNLQNQWNSTLSDIRLVPILMSEKAVLLGELTNWIGHFPGADRYGKFDDIIQAQANANAMRQEHRSTIMVALVGQIAGLQNGQINALNAIKDTEPPLSSDAQSKVLAALVGQIEHWRAYDDKVARFDAIKTASYALSDHARGVVLTELAGQVWWRSAPEVRIRAINDIKTASSGLPDDARSAVLIVLASQVAVAINAFNDAGANMSEDTRSAVLAAFAGQNIVVINAIKDASADLSDNAQSGVLIALANQIHWCTSRGKVDSFTAIKDAISNLEDNSARSAALIALANQIQCFPEERQNRIVAFKAIAKASTNLSDEGERSMVLIALTGHMQLLVRPGDAKKAINVITGAISDLSEEDVRSAVRRALDSKVNSLQLGQ